MSLSQTGRIEICSIVAVLALATLGGCGDDEEPDLHLGSNNVPGTIGGVGGGMNNSANGETNNNGGPPDVFDRANLKGPEVVYLEDDGGVVFRTLDFDGMTDWFLFRLEDVEGGGDGVDTGDITVAANRTLLVYAPSSGDRLLTVRLNGEVVSTVSGLGDLGVVRSPRTLASDDAVVFVAGATGANGDYTASSLYSLELSAGADPAQINVDLSTCSVLRDIATHPGDERQIFGVRDGCDSLVDAGVVSVDLDTGATELIMGLTEADPDATLGHVVVANHAQRLYVLGSGSFDTIGDLAPDAEGTGIYELNLLTGEFEGVAAPNNPDYIVRSFALLDDSQTFIFDLELPGGRFLFVGNASGLGPVTESGKSTSPILR